MPDDVLAVNLENLEPANLHVLARWGMPAKSARRVPLQSLRTACLLAAVVSVLVFGFVFPVGSKSQVRLARRWLAGSS